MANKSFQTLCQLMMSAKVLIFDFDGTLVDSNPIKLKGFDACFAEFKEAWPEIKAYCYSNHHTPRWEKFKYVYESILKKPYSDSISQDLHQRYEKATTQQVCDAPEIPGAEAFLKSVSKRYKNALVSSTPDTILKHILKTRGWANYFEAIQGAPVNKSSWITNYLKEQQASPRETLFFGDTVEDATAAEASGCVFVAVASGVGKNLKAAVLLNDFREVHCA